MITFILFCLILCLYPVRFLKFTKSDYSKLPPIYSGLVPVIGHTHLLLCNSVKLWQRVTNVSNECTRKGGVIRCFIGSELYYFITDPDDCYIAANACLQKHFAYDFGKSWLGDGLITASGPIWKHHRKLLSPAFSLQVLHGFLDIFNSQARKLINVISDKIDKGPFDIATHFKIIALETISLTAFGINADDDENFNQTYMEAVDNILSLITQRFQKFWLQNNFIYKLVGLKKREDELINILNGMSNKVIQKKKSILNNNKHLEKETTTKTTGIKFKPFLDLLLELSDDETLTDKEIREEVDTAIVAGFDTTSWVLTYTLIALGSYPEIQDRVYNELTGVFGDSDRDVTKEDLALLVYTEAVLKETMRLYTTGPVGLRYVDRDVKLKNYTMQAGSNCVLSLYGLHRHPVWGPDAEHFKPERWLDATTLPDSNTFGAFSVGKRTCIGKTYALMSMKTTLAHLLRQYRVTGDVTKLVFKLDFLLKPVSGHKVSFVKRN